MITGTAPPSTDHAAPATFEAASEQRNAITAAISSSVPKRPSGCRAGGGPEHLLARHPLRLRGLVGQAAGRQPQLVPTGPGVTALTSTPSARVQLGERARERQLGGLRHRVRHVRA